MKPIKMVNIILSKDEIDKMDKKEKKRFIMFTCMIRDLNLLQKCLAYVSNEKPKEEPFVSANTTISFFFLKTLLSKIHEMWFFVEENKVLEDYQRYSQGLKESIDAIKNFFSDKKIKNMFSFIRNKFGFHYEYWNDVDDLIDEAIKPFPHFQAWLSSEDSTNEIFTSSNGVILKVIFTEMNKEGFLGDDKQNMNTLFDLALEGARLFQEFSKRYLVEAFSITWEQKEEIEIKVPIISEVELPLIVTR